MPTSRRLVPSGSDFYATPAWCTQALLAHEKFHGSTWEPACGDGSMSRVLEAEGLTVYSSDLINRGYGDHPLDFLQQEQQVDNIITNPPYSIVDAFVKKGLQLYKKKLALLLRLAFLEGQQRYKEIFQETPPQKIWCFSPRATFYPDGAERKGSGTLAYAWFVWDKAYSNQRQTILDWIPER